MRLAVLVLFAAQTLAAPMVLDPHLPGATLKDNGCSTLRFPGSGSRFVYDYAGETLNSVAGSTDMTTGIRMTAKVSIAQVSKCTYEMEIVSSKLVSKSATSKTFDPVKENKNENHKFQHQLELNTILFSLDLSGGISAVHAHKKDPAHIVNIKRGILSTLQLQKDSTTETDINGECSMTMSTDSNGNIIKTKDLTNCEKRGINEIGLQTTTIQSEASPLKPLASSSKCTYKVDQTSIKEVSCEEEHVFRPFSAGYETTSGAVTTVKQTMKKVKEDKTKAKKPAIQEYTVNSGMLFDHAKEEMTNVPSITSEVDEIMSRLVDKKGNLAAKQDSAHEFTALVQVLRKMDDKRMKPIWEKYFDCRQSKVCTKDDTTLLNVYRSYLLDAVTYCGTTTCVSMIRDVIVDGDVSGEAMNMFLQGIAFVGKTSSDMIKDVLHIVKKQPSRQAFLTLGTLLGRHCRNNPNECHYDKNSQISRAQIYLMDLLANKCKKQDKPEKLEEYIMSLKAIANAGSPIKAFNKIVECFETSKHTNLTVAAMDAVSSMPCAHDRSEQLLALVTDTKMCPEKRTYAFRALMKCPDEPVLHKLIHHTAKEPSKQLGSYMYTTLTNIEESSDPKNAEWKKMMANLKQKDASLAVTKVDLPMHQFSRNFEKSFMVDSMVKSGLTAESDLIFNPNSFLPKSAFFNLTANVMGVPVHIVETAVMVDGIETVLEDVFGKDGVLPEMTLLNVFNVTLTKERLQELTEKRNEQNDKKFAKKNRPKRAIEDNLTKMQKAINLDRKQPSGSISFKIMGQEVKVFSYDDLFWAIDKIDNMNVVTMLMDVAKGVKKTFTKSVLVLEVTHEVATGLGVPLRLKLMGSAVSTLQLDGKFDIRNMFWGPMGMHINGLVRQSSVLEVSGSMSMESQFFSSGMFVNATSLSTQVVKGNVEYKQGKILKVNIDTPDEPMQLFNFSSTPFMFLNEESTLVEGAPRKISPDNCLKSEYIGLGVCTSIRLPLAYREYEAPYFPLSGPANFGIKIVKADPKLTTYQFLVDMKKSGKATEGEISFSTPKATYERTLKASMKYAEEGTDRKLTVGTEEIGKGTEFDFIYNTETNSVAMKSRSNLLKDMEYNLELFNATTTAGREYGIRMNAGYDWYKFNTENKLVLKKTGPMLVSTTMYYPKKTVTGSVEFNTVENKMTIEGAHNDNKQTIDMTYAVKDGLTLTMKHIQTNNTVILDGRMISTKDTNTLRLSGDVNGNKAVTEFSLETAKDGYTVKAMLDAAGKKSELSGKYINAKNVELILSGNLNGKKGEAKVGYYTPNEDRFVSLTVAGKEITKAGLFVSRAHMTSTKNLKWEVNALEKKLEVFGTLTTTTEKQELDIGAAYNQYRIGSKFDYKNQHKETRELCTSVYFNSDKVNMDPFLVCGAYESLAHPNLKTYVHKRVVFTSKLNKYNKVFKVQSDFENHDSHATIKSFTTINDKTFWNILDVTYGDLSNANVGVSFGAGDLKKDKPIVGMQLFTKKAGAEQIVTLEGSFKEKSLGFRTTYTAKTGILNTKNEILVNKKALPVSTEMRYFSGDVSGSEFTLKYGKWATTTSASVQLKKTKSFINFEFNVKEGNVEKVKLYSRNSGVWTKNNKQVEQQIGAVIAKKTFQYGYMAELVGSSTDKIYGQLRLDWSTKKYSQVKLAFTNNKKEAELALTVEYLPKKTMTHSALLDKKNSKVTVTVEFLPKMFTKYSAQLDQTNGFTLTQDVSVSWDKFEKSVSFVNKYINTNKKFHLSTKVDKFFTLSTDVSKKDNPKITLTAKVMKDVYEVEGTVFPKKTSMNIFVRVNSKDIASLTGDFKAQAKSAQVSIAGRLGKNKASITGTYKTAKKVSFDIDMTVNKKVVGGFSMEYNDKAQSASIAVQSGKKDVAGLFARVDSKNNVFIFKVNGKKNLLEVVARKTPTKQEYFLKFNAKTLKQMVELSAKLDEDKKMVTLAVQHNKVTCGLKMRADWDELIVSTTMFCNKQEIGWEAKKVKNSLVFTLDVTPKHSVQMKISVKQDKIIECTISRIFNGKVTKEVTFSFELTPKMVKLVMNLNEVSISKMMKKVKPHMEMLTKHSKKVSKKAKEIREQVMKQAKTMMKDMDLSVLKAGLYKINIPTSDEMKSHAKKAMESVNGMKESFDKIDYATAQKKLGDASLSTLKTVSKATSKALLSASTGMEALSKNIPSYIKNTEQAIKDLQKFIEDNKSDIQNNLELVKKLATDLSEIAVKLSTDVTKSAKPVAEKIVVLLKDFKIRKKTMAQWVEILVAKLNKIYKEYKTEGMQMYSKYSKETMAKIEELSKTGTQLAATLQTKGTEYVLNMEMPYANMTVEQTVAFLKEKVTEMQTKYNKEMIQKKLDAFWKDTKDLIMNYKTTSERIAEKYYKMIKDEVDKLPEVQKKAFKELETMMKKYKVQIDELMVEVKALMKELEEFLKPLADHMKIVQKSLKKHFGPLAKIVMKKLKQKVRSLELPEIVSQIKNFELVNPMDTEMVKELITKLSGLKISNMTVGSIAKMTKETVTKDAQKYQKMILDLIQKIKELVAKLKELKKEDVYKKMSIITTDAKAQADKISKEMLVKYTEMVSKVSKESKATFDKLMKKYNELSVKDVEDFLTKSTTEMASILKQLSEMKLDETVLTALKKIDITKTLESFKIPEKVNAVLDAMKKINTTEMMVSVKNVVARMNKAIDNIRAIATPTILKMYKSYEKVINYIKSIPKKEYKVWKSEVKNFALKNAKTFYKYLEGVYDIMKPQVAKFIDAVYKDAVSMKDLNKMAWELYEANKKIGQELYNSNVDIMKEFYAAQSDSAKDIYNEVYEDFNSKYVISEKLIKIMAGKAGRVWKDVAEPTRQVKEHYSNITMATYKKLAARVTKMTTMAVEDLKENLKGMKDLTEAEIMKQYNVFLTKYGDKTWEQIADMIMEFALKSFNEGKAFAENKFNEGKALAVAEYNKLLVKVEELRAEYKAEVEKLVKKFDAEYQEMYKKALAKYSEVMPIAKELYKKYTELATAKAMEMRALSLKYYKMAKNILEKYVAEAKKLYESNKKKTIPALAKEMEKMITEALEVRYEMLVNKTMTKFNEIVKMIEEIVKEKRAEFEGKMKAYKAMGEKMVAEYKVTLKTKIIPELMVEMESMINQTLRNSVEIYKESKKAFATHIETAKKSLKEMEKPVKDMIKKMKEEFAPIQKDAKELMTKVQENLIELYEQIIKIVEAQLKDVQALDSVKKTMKITQKFKDLAVDVLELAKLKIDELKKHKIVIKYKKMTTKKFMEYKSKAEAKFNDMKQDTEAKFNEYKKQATDKYTEAKALSEKKYAEVKAKVMKYYNSPEMKKVMAQVKGMMAEMKLMRKSIMFTANKLSEKASPWIIAATPFVKQMDTYVINALQSSSGKFLDAPEETFWKSVNNMKTTVTETMEFLKALDYEVPTTSALMSDLTALVKDSTDDYAKKTYAKIVTQIKDMIKMVKTEMARMQKEVERIQKDVPKYLKKQSDMIVKKTKAYGKMMKEEANKQYKLMAKTLKKSLDKSEAALLSLITKFESACASLMKAYKACPLNEINSNPIWSEIYEAFYTHELVEESAQLFDISKKELKKLVKGIKLNKLTDMLRKDIKRVFDLLEDGKKIAMTKYADLLKVVESLKKQLKAKTTEMKAQYVKMQKETMTKLKDAQNTGMTKAKEIQSDVLEQITKYTAMAQKFLNEKTIEDIVKLLDAKYEEGVALAKKQYALALQKKDEYIKISKELYAEYRKKTETLYKEYEKKAMDAYKMYANQLKTKYAELEKMAIELYKEYKVIFETYYKEYKTVLETYYKKYVEPTFNKLYKQVEDELKQLKKELEGRTKQAEEMIKIAETKLKDGQTQLMNKKDSMVKAIRSRLTGLKKMTVKETIEELKTMPKRTQVLITKATKTATKIYEQITKDVNAKYADLIKSGQELKTQVMKFSKDKYDEIVVLVTPTYKSLKSTADSVANEIEETAIFVYRYYRVKDNVNKLQEVFDMKFSELKMLVDGKVNEMKMNLNAEMKKYMPLVTKFYEEYKTQVEDARTKLMKKVDDFKKDAIVKVEEYKKEAKRSYGEGLKQFEVYKAKSFQLAKDLRAQAKTLLSVSADKVLRSIHSALVFADQTDINEFLDLLTIKEKDLKAFLKLTYDDLVNYINSILDKVTLEKVSLDFDGLTKMFNKMKKEIPKYIQMDKENMQMTINIPHNGLLEPKLSDNFKTIKKVWPKVNLRVRKSLKDATRQMKVYQKDAAKMMKDLKAKVMTNMKVYKAQAMDLMKTVKKVGMKFYKEKIAQLKKLYNENAKQYVTMARKFILEQWAKFLKETKTIRQDFMDVVEKNKKLADVMQTRGKFYYAKYSKQLMAMYKSFMKSHGNKFAKIINNMSKDIYRKMKVTGNKINLKKPMESYEEVVKMLNKMKVMIEKESKKAYKDYAPQAKLMTKKYYAQLKTKVTKLQKQLSGLTLPIKMSFDAMMKNGLDTKTMNKHMQMYNKYQVKTMRYLTQQFNQMKKTICKKENKLCNLANKAIKEIQDFMEQYGNTAVEKMTFQVDRNMRLAKKKVAKLAKAKDMMLEPTYRSVAMIFGNDHVITFDGKFYDFVDYKRRACEYLLAHDFQDDKFTVKSTDDALTIDVEDMSVKIMDNGKTETKINGKKSTSLPVGTESSKCFRYNNFVKCIFEKAGLKVYVDLDNKVTTFYLSGWHHGKTHGILGTNNREEYDDWKMPNGKIAQNVYQFANSYALTKKCNVRPGKNEKPKQKPSKRCTEMFEDEQFKSALTEEQIKSFTKACKADTSMAKKKDYKTSHCNTAAAAIIYEEENQMKLIDMPEECKSVITNGKVRQPGTTWTQKPLKRAVDVVVIMSERATVTKQQKNSLIKTLDSLGNQMKKARYNTRFALIGFGGNGITEQAHQRPLDGKIFTPNMKKLTVELSKVDFNGKTEDSNDAFDAILRATTLNFRPGASRVFIFYNSEPHTSHMMGPSHTETLTALTEEVDAALFVFDSFTFKNLKGSRGKIIGQSNGRMFSDKSKAIPNARIDYPSSEFKELVKASSGGMYSNKIKKHQPVSNALFKSLKIWLTKDTQKCKTCTLANTWFGRAYPICKADPKAKC